jgi:hypothetical protein
MGLAIHLVLATLGSTTRGALMFTKEVIVVMFTKEVIVGLAVVIVAAVVTVPSLHALLLHLLCSSCSSVGLSIRLVVTVGVYSWHRLGTSRSVHVFYELHVVHVMQQCAMILAGQLLRDGAANAEAVAGVNDLGGDVEENHVRGVCVEELVVDLTRH